MKNLKTFIYYLLVSMLLAAICTSCNDKVTITGIELDKTEVILSIGGTATITANLLPYYANDKLKWTTTNSNVAVVESDAKEAAFSEAIVTAKATGKAVITVTTKNEKHSATCAITVINAEPELVLVEGGTFTMGCTQEQGESCNENETPSHTVTVSSFYIGKYEVTQQQWEAIMENNPSYFKGDRNLPVERISLNEIQQFITKINALTGKKYRLPTEAEWEYAARGGKLSKGYKYSGSNNANSVAWYMGNSNSKTQPVGTKEPNELGIYDMSGNVFEWCSDYYGNYTADSQIDPLGPDYGNLRVTRGGAHGIGTGYCRVSFRFGSSPNTIVQDLGFRLVHPKD